MLFTFFHCQESVDIRTAQEIEERTFDAVREIVSENNFFYIIFFCLFFEFSISPIPEISFRVLFCSFSCDDDKLSSCKKCPDEFFIFRVSLSCLMITMYKKQIL